jgi:hypothetical protein
MTSVATLAAPTLMRWFMSRRSLFYPTFLAALSGVLLATACANAATFVVSDTNSLGAAIQSANTTPGPDTIVFDLPGPGPHVIDLGRSLPVLTSDIEILNDRPGDASVTVRRSTAGGTPEFRIFQIAPGSTVLIAGADDH